MKSLFTGLVALLSVSVFAQTKSGNTSPALVEAAAASVGMSQE